LWASTSALGDNVARMTDAASTLLSRSEVDRSGNLLRAVRPEIHSVRSDGVISAGELTIGASVTAEYSFEDDGNELTAGAVADALRTVLIYREGNSVAMQVAHRDLARIVEPLAAAVSSRHKRMQAILEKLHRFPHMRLSQMDDIAGCRVVVEGLEQIEVLREALAADYNIHAVNDYISNPKSTGYRAMHIVLELPDTNFAMQPGVNSCFVEVQVRTPRQNEWADQVEAATGTTGIDLKGGIASSLPEDLVEYVKIASEIRSLADRGELADTSLETRLAELREIVKPYFRKR